jgi:hypothetical protein
VAVIEETVTDPKTGEVYRSSRAASYSRTIADWVRTIEESKELIAESRRAIEKTKELIVRPERERKQRWRPLAGP